MADYFFKNICIVENNTAAIFHKSVNTYDRYAMLGGTLFYLTGNVVPFYRLRHYDKHIEDIIIYKIENARLATHIGCVVIKVTESVEKQYLIAFIYTIAAYGRYYFTHIVRLHA